MKTVVLLDPESDSDRFARVLLDPRGPVKLYRGGDWIGKGTTEAWEAACGILLVYTGSWAQNPAGHESKLGA